MIFHQKTISSIQKSRNKSPTSVQLQFVELRHWLPWQRKFLNDRQSRMHRKGIVGGVKLNCPMTSSLIFFRLERKFKESIKKYLFELLIWTHIVKTLYECESLLCKVYLSKNFRKFPRILREFRGVRSNRIAIWNYVILVWEWWSDVDVYLWTYIENVKRRQLFLNSQIMKTLYKIRTFVWKC